MGKYNIMHKVNVDLKVLVKVLYVKNTSLSVSKRWKCLGNVEQGTTITHYHPLSRSIIPGRKSLRISW